MDLWQLDATDLAAIGVPSAPLDGAVRAVAYLSRLGAEVDNTEIPVRL